MSNATQYTPVINVWFSDKAAVQRGLAAGTHQVPIAPNEVAKLSEEQRRVLAENALPPTTTRSVVDNPTNLELETIANALLDAAAERVKKAEAEAKKEKADQERIDATYVENIEKVLATDPAADGAPAVPDAYYVSAEVREKYAGEVATWKSGKEAAADARAQAKRDATAALANLRLDKFCALVPVAAARARAGHLRPGELRDALEEHLLVRPLNELFGEPAAAHAEEPEGDYKVADKGLTDGEFEVLAAIQQAFAHRKDVDLPRAMVEHWSENEDHATSYVYVEASFAGQTIAAYVDVATALAKKNTAS